MKKLILLATLVAALLPMAVAQSISAAASSAVRGSSISQEPHNLPPKAPKWCKPCLYYSGDIDTTNPNADAIFDGYNSAYRISAQVFGAFKDTTKTVKATGAAINAFSDSDHALTNPTPYQINTGMSNGNCGEIVCSGTARASVIPTGRTDTNWGVPTEYTIFEKKLEKACTLKKGSSYWLLIYPQSKSSLWYESDEVSDPHPINHVGWKNQVNQSIYNAPTFGDNCQVGSGDFSFGLTGR